MPIRPRHHRRNRQAGACIQVCLLVTCAVRHGVFYRLNEARLNWASRAYTAQIHLMRGGKPFLSREKITPKPRAAPVKSIFANIAYTRLRVKRGDHMKHAYFSDELQLRRKMLFRLLRRFDFDHPVFPAGGRIEDILPNPKGANDMPTERFCLDFVHNGPFETQITR